MLITPELSRIIKTMVDAGRLSFPEAEARLSAATLTVHIDASCAHEPAAQAAALTAILTGVRCFCGGVWLRGAVDTPVVLPLRAATLGDAALEFGAQVGCATTSRTILIGPSHDYDHSGWSVRAWWDDWHAGIRPVHDAVQPDCARNSLSGIAAGALAVGHAFLAESGENLRGPQVAQMISLWAPGSDEQGPQRCYLPDALWLVGLGNLGQAYLWCLSLLPYRKADELLLVLQDEDTVRDVNWGTSILVPHHRYGMLKTRLAEDWALQRGFRVRRLDYFVNRFTRRRMTDPPIALSGLDRISARLLVDEVGFERVIDCGLGGTARNYGRFRLNVFDSDYTAGSHFTGIEDIIHTEANLRLPAYQEVLAEGSAAACGMAELAGASVAVPFVSVFAATLAVTQAIRIASGESQVRTVVGSFNALDSIKISEATVLPPRVGFVDQTGPDPTLAPAA